MMGTDTIKDGKGFSMVELLVVMVTIGIIALIGVPTYSNFTAKNSVRSAVNDLLQNSRLASTMAIKENQNYVIAFELAGPDTYSIGFDANNDGIPEGYDAGPVRVINLRGTYGPNVVFGTFTGNGPDEPISCPACIGIGGATYAFPPTAGPVFMQFLPDGSTANTGSVFIMHNTPNTGFTYMLRVSYLAGKVDMWKWDGEAGNAAPTVINNCTVSPRQHCGWTEIR